MALQHLNKMFLLVNSNFWWYPRGSSKHVRKCKKVNEERFELLNNKKVARPIHEEKAMKRVAVIKNANWYIKTVVCLIKFWDHNKKIANIIKIKTG